MLRKNGILNAYQLSQAPEKWVEKKMTKLGLRTSKELRGVSCIWRSPIFHATLNVLISFIFFSYVNLNFAGAIYPSELWGLYLL